MLSVSVAALRRWRRERRGPISPAVSGAFGTVSLISRTLFKSLAKRWIAMLDNTCAGTWEPRPPRAHGPMLAKPSDAMPLLDAEDTMSWTAVVSAPSELPKEQLARLTDELVEDYSVTETDPATGERRLTERYRQPLGLGGLCGGWKG